MTEQVMVTLITAGQAITLALIGLIGIWLGRVRKDVGRVKTDAEAARVNAAAANVNSAAARVQVENDHSTNMRVENDSRHAETKGWIDDLRAAFVRELRAVRQEMLVDRQAANETQRSNNDTHRALAERVTTLEQSKEH